jgi:hypothetical protein
LYTPSDGSLQLGRLSTSDGSTFLEAVRIDNSGRLLVGTSTARSNVDASTGLLAPQVQIEVNGRWGLVSFDYSQFGKQSSSSLFSRTKSGSVGGNVAVISDDILGEFLLNGADGTSLIEAASISCGVDGTPGANDMPVRLVFSTTADGASSPTERLRITSAGRVGIGTTSPGHNLEIKGSFPDFAISDSDTANDKFRILYNSGSTQLQVDPNNVSSGSHLLVSVENTERARIDSSGR